MKEEYFRFLNEQLERESQAKPRIAPSPLHLLVHGYAQSTSEKAAYQRDNEFDLFERMTGKQDSNRELTPLEKIKKAYETI